MKPFLFLLILTSIRIFAIGQTQFYVSPSGDDTWPGTITQPWQTIQKACDDALPGSTVFIRQGIYKREFSMNVSGSANNEITFMNYPGETAILDGDSVSSIILYIHNRSYIKLQGLVFRNAIGNNSEGIEISGRAHHIEVSGCTFYNIHFSSDSTAVAGPNKNANPLIVYGNFNPDSIYEIKITGNEVYNCRTGYSEAISLDGNISNFEIKNNYVHHISNIGICVVGGYNVCQDSGLDFARYGVIAGNLVTYCYSPYAEAAGIYSDGSRYNLIERNISHHNQYGFELGCEKKNKKSIGLKMINNLAYANTSSGLALGGYNFPATGRVIDCEIRNNTFYKNDTENGNLGEIAITRAESCTLRNNILVANPQGIFIATDNDTLFGNLLDYNLYHFPNISLIPYWIVGSQSFTALSLLTPATGWETSGLEADPEFVAPFSDDFHLTLNSQAINSGDPLSNIPGTETDLDSLPRISGSTVDRGCYELQQSMSVNEISRNEYIAYVYPNPAQTQATLTWSGVQEGAFVLRDMLGRAVRREVLNVSSGSTRLDLSALPKGIYLWQVQSAGYSKNRKLVVE